MGVYKVKLKMKTIIRIITAFYSMVVVINIIDCIIMNRGFIIGEQITASTLLIMIGILAIIKAIEKEKKQ